MIAGLILFSLITSFGLTELVRLSAHKMALIDVPVDRSMHTVPTARGGGLGVVGAVALTVLLWLLSEPVTAGLSRVVFVSILMAALGFWDDRVSLSARYRFAVQLALAALITWIFATGASIESVFGFTLQVPFAFTGMILVITWMTNLFNFMDGSDGLAGTQALVAGLAWGALAWWCGDRELLIASLILAAASGGFLIRNWSPAKIFMGDVGSVFLGFLFAALAIWTALKGTLPFAAVICVHGLFIVDATFTLITRLRRGKRPAEAHRTHAYQRWIQSGRSHRFVALIYGAVALLWLTPMAFVIASGTSVFTQYALLAAAWTPLIAFVSHRRAGQEFHPLGSAT